MDKNFKPSFRYTVSVDSMLGGQLLAYIDEQIKVDKAAEEVAAKYKAIGYYPALEGEAGGLSAIVVNKTDFFPKVDWESETLDEQPDSKIVAPRVQHQQKILRAGDPNIKELMYSEEANVKVSRPMPIDKVMHLISRNEAASWVGLTLKTKGEDSLIREYNRKVQKAENHKLSPLENQYITEQLTKAIKEDAALMSALNVNEIKCVIVDIYSGTKQALEAYEEFSALPVIPAGTMGKMLNMEPNAPVPGFIADEFFGKIYLWSSVAIVHPDIIEKEAITAENVEKEKEFTRDLVQRLNEWSKQIAENDAREDAEMERQKAEYAREAAEEERLKAEAQNAAAPADEDSETKDGGVD